MLEDKRINYIELPSKDFSDTKEFYGKVFGWTFQDYGDNYVAFNDGRLDGGFYRSPLKSDSTKGGAALVVLYADDLEATLKRITDTGAEICMEIFSFPGGRRFHFLDPSGNELAVWSDK
ncbi:MAG: VOC family protein [Rhodothermaceae bacterium]|nr:VOC family protein [Rhodothermaceae bacterium]MXZ57220.1 VOC family protein [Rhodothermaceae bacterium]MYB90917.1 VOC family protein [Rhodothermaceae bacterium]MYD67792.1 VOC family protein [Rhodothermaceae bacterium]MYG45087.1 VOC family protein [Rhodothermaceae bacterium]